MLAEALFKVCQNNGVNLLHYNFNKPCKGKDQCNREKATSKSLMSNYTDAGSDIITVEDAFTALHYGNRLDHSQKCVAEISEHTVLSEEMHLDI